MPEVKVDRKKLKIQQIESRKNWWNKKAQANQTWALFSEEGRDRRYETDLHFFLRMLDDGYMAASCNLKEYQKKGRIIFDPAIPTANFLTCDPL